MDKNEMAIQGTFLENDGTTISPAGVNDYAAGEGEFVYRYLTGGLISEAGNGHGQNTILSFNRVCSNAGYYHKE